MGHISPVVLRQEVGRRIRQARQDAELTIVVAAQRAGGSGTASRIMTSSPAVMRNQLQHLALINELPTVTLRILPISVASTEAMIGPFSILDFPCVGQPSISYASHPLGEERQDKAEFVEPARLLFTHLRSLALEPNESVALIERLADEMWSS